MLAVGWLVLLHLFWVIIVRILIAGLIDFALKVMLTYYPQLLIQMSIHCIVLSDRGVLSLIDNPPWLEVLFCNNWVLLVFLFETDSFVWNSFFESNDFALPLAPRMHLMSPPFYTQWPCLANLMEIAPGNLWSLLIRPMLVTPWAFWYDIWDFLWHSHVGRGIKFFYKIGSEV